MTFSARRFGLTIVLACLALAGLVGAASLVNINTADLSLLQTLNGIGPSLAERIIAYRTAHGPFATIEDIMQVSGIKEAVFAKIKDSITVTGGEAAGPEDVSVVTASPAERSTKSKEETLGIDLGLNQSVAVGVPFELGLLGTNTSSGHFTWSFGDGTAARGTVATHVYYVPGRYNVVVTGRRAGGPLLVARAQITVFNPELRVSSVALGTLIQNHGGTELNLGGWQIWSHDSHFVLPENTIIDPGASLVIPALAWAGAPSDGGLALLNPSGTLVAQAGSLLATKADERAWQELKTKLEVAQARLASLRQASLAGPIVANTSSSPVGVVAGTSTVIELKPATTWWGNLVNKIWP